MAGYGLLAAITTGCSICNSINYWYTSITYPNTTDCVWPINYAIPSESTSLVIYNNIYTVSSFTLYCIIRLISNKEHVQNYCLH